MTILQQKERIMARLSRYNLAAVARDTDLSYQTVLAVVRGSNTNPSLETLTKLETFLNTTEQ